MNVADHGLAPAIVLEGRGLYHIYREAEVETIALRGTDITLHAGTWTSVAGPSGSGKSTLLNVLGGLMEPSAGQVLMDGRDVGRLEEAERARLRRTKLGMIMQRDNLHPLLSVTENVALPIELAGERARGRPAELIESVGLRETLGPPPHQLSGGEAQRAAIAVALARRPALLLADELTGELDEATTEEILDLLTELRDGGLAILTVTHNPTVSARADRRLVMSDGTLSEETSDGK